MHTSTNSEVTWFGTKGISCGDWKPMGGHAIAIAFTKNSEYNGQHCDSDMKIERNYICKALI